MAHFKYCEEEEPTGALYLNFYIEIVFDFVLYSCLSVGHMSIYDIYCYWP